MADEEENPEPTRPGSRRSPIVSIGVVLVSVYLLWSLREETIYFFRSREPRQVSLSEGPPQEWHNTFVRAQGVPDRARTVILDGRWEMHRAIFRVLGSGSRLFVAQPRKYRMPPRVFSDVYKGRLLRMADQAYFPQVYRYFIDHIRTSIDLPTAELLGQVGKAPVTLGDRHGMPFQLKADDDLFVSVAFPGEVRVQFDRTRYPKPQESDAVMVKLGLEWGPMEDSRAFRSYVARADDEQAAALMARFRDVTLKVGVIPRTAAIRCRWGDVRRDGELLILKPLDGPAPTPFVRAENGLLRPSTPAPSTLALVPSRIRSVEMQKPLEIPKDAMLLREGDTPGDYWYVVAADVLLLGLIAINLWMLFRRRSGVAS